ncbi:hypothetical protein BJX96DRAFT_151116 [Aspergillus floccosus]
MEEKDAVLPTSIPPPADNKPSTLHTICLALNRLTQRLLYKRPVVSFTLLLSVYFLSEFSCALYCPATPCRRFGYLMQSLVILITILVFSSQAGKNWDVQFYFYTN